jgi:hypothetical protein
VGAIPDKSMMRNKRGKTTMMNSKAGLVGVNHLITRKMNNQAGLLGVNHLMTRKMDSQAGLLGVNHLMTRKVSNNLIHTLLVRVNHTGVKMMRNPMMKKIIIHRLNKMIKTKMPKGRMRAAILKLLVEMPKGRMRAAILKLLVMTIIQTLKTT